MLPVVPFAALAAASFIGARWARREWRRINAELDAAAETEKQKDLERPTLRRDPQTGDWRPTGG